MEEEFIEIKGNRSLWREYEFLFTIVRDAIVPELELTEVIKNWPRIVDNLSESPRKRKLQCVIYAPLLQFS